MRMGRSCVRRAGPCQWLAVVEAEAAVAAVVVEVEAEG